MPATPLTRPTGPRSDTPRDSEISGYSWSAEVVAPLRRLGVPDLVPGETGLTGAHLSPLAEYLQHPG